MPMSLLRICWIVPVRADILTPWNTRQNLASKQDAIRGSEKRQKDKSSHHDKGDHVGFLVADSITHEPVDGETNH